MGLSFRKSVRLGGGLRLNFSKRGIGLSAGVPGLRISTGPRGTRLSVGKGGLNYQTSLSSKVRMPRKKTRSDLTADAQSLSPVDDPLIVRRPTNWRYLWFSTTAFLSIGIFSQPTILEKVKYILGLSPFYLLCMLFYRGSKKIRGYRLYTQAQRTDSLDESVALFEKAYYLYPHAGVQAQLSERLFDMGKFEEALPGLQQASAISSDQSINLLLIKCLMELGRWQQAIDVLPETDWQKDPSKFMSVISLKAECFVGLKEYDRALEILSKGLAKRSEVSVEPKRHLRIIKARVFVSMGKVDQARKELTELLEEAPNFDLGALELQKLKTAA
jgi:predicted negative regulator of RcsB-dependent stress response